MKTIHQHKPPYIAESGWLANRLNVISGQLHKIRKGSGYRSRRRLLRREYDELWARFVAAKLAEK